MGDRRKLVVGELRTVLMMIVVQVAYGGVVISYKLVAIANNEGSSFTVLMAYSYLFASAFLLPLAFLLERASLQQNLLGKAVALAGAAYSTAVLNLIPGTTFIPSEGLNIGGSTGQAKVGGTTLGIGGAMIMTVYENTGIQLWSTHLNIMKHVAPHNVSWSNQMWGCVMAFGACLSYSPWLIIQARTNNKFPWAHTSAALMSIMASIQSLTFALFMQPDLSHWKMVWDIRLFAFIYTGIVASGLVWILMNVCVAMKGPPCAFNFHLLTLVLVTITGSLILDEKLYAGSIIGFILIVLGLYMVLWGKAKELKKLITDQNNAAEATHEGDSSSSVNINISNHDEDDKITNTNHIMNPDSATAPSSFFNSSDDDLSTEQKQVSTK